MSYKRVNIEISNVCNLQCSFCPVVERDKQLMTPEAFVKLAEQLRGMVEEVCLHLMGEPLLHPQLAAIVEACEVNELPINLTTNGLLLQGERRELLLKPIVRQVNISLHSYEANFGMQGITPYYEKIARFLREAEARRPELYINLRLWDLADPAAESSANLWLRQKLEETYGLAIDSKAIDVRRRKNVKLSGRIYLHFDSRFTWPSPQLPVRAEQGFCHGLSQHFGVHADGTVVPCCLDKEATIPLGNIHQEPLADILQSPRASAMREGFARGELVEDLCRRCPFIERFDRKARRLGSLSKS